MVSKTAKYAVRAVVYLAAQSEEGREYVPIGDVAKALGVPGNYLSKVTHTLVRAGVLESVRGPNGGFRLAVPAGELTVGWVVEPFDQVGGPIPCLLREGPCDPDRPCVAHDRWRDVAAATYEFFDETTVAELVRAATESGARY